MLWHQSGVNVKGEAFVQLVLDGKLIAQMTTDQARDHAHAILETVESATTDAFLMEYLQVKAPINEVVELLQDFRRWREAHGKSTPPSDPAEFIRP